MHQGKQYKLISPTSKEYTVGSDGIGYVRIKGGLRKLTSDQLTKIQTLEAERNSVASKK